MLAETAGQSTRSSVFPFVQPSFALVLWVGNLSRARKRSIGIRISPAGSPRGARRSNRFRMWCQIIARPIPASTGHALAQTFSNEVSFLISVRIPGRIQMPIAVAAMAVDQREPQTLCIAVIWIPQSRPSQGQESNHEQGGTSGCQRKEHTNEKRGEAREIPDGFLQGEFGHGAA